MYFSDEHAAFPQSVWALDQCDISLGTLSSGSLCIIIKRHQLSPFKKSKTTVISGKNDNLTRQWCEIMQRKSRYNNNKRVFSKSLTDLALRPGATSFVPQFVRDGFDLIFWHALNNPTLFTASVNSQSVDRTREAINHGTMPPMNDQSDYAALAQTILSFYAEMPDSLIPGSLLSDFWSYYVDSLKQGTPLVDRLKAVLQGLPVPNLVNFNYLMSFLTLWAEDSNTQVRLPELLGSYLIRFRDEDIPASFKGQSTDVILKIFEDFLALRDTLNFPDDTAFEEYVNKLKSSAEPTGAAVPAAATASVSDGRIPVTALDKDDITQLMHSVDNPHLVLDLNDIAPSTSPVAVSHKHNPSSCSIESEGETRGRTDSGGLSQDSIDEEPGEKEFSEGSLDSPRRDPKHSSTRARASQLFKKFKQSFSSKKKVHNSVGTTPSSSIHPGTPEEDSNSSSGCNTPTGSYTPSAPIAQQNSLESKNDDAAAPSHQTEEAKSEEAKTDDAKTDDAQNPPEGKESK